MKKLFIVVEGETEVRFIREIIYPRLIQMGIFVDAQKWLTNRKLGIGGGGRNFDHIENHLQRLVKHYRADENTYLSTMIDFYAFPLQGNTIYDDEVRSTLGGKQKTALLERKLNERIQFHHFIPYIQLHEFETLLLSNPSALINYYTDKEREIEHLVNEIAESNPESINDTPEGAPSKRIEKYLPSFKSEKATAGPFVANKIGLEVLRSKCEHFSEWLTKLESI